MESAGNPLGEQVGEVFVEIDYAILQHFSSHLYSSPNKAIEELVTNGYDALASKVCVWLPGAHARDCLLVLDNGVSMDTAGLKRLWWIASSPKSEVVDRIAVSDDGLIRRKMIGKFGIGKLASYAVGERLSHLCRRNDEYLLITVDYALAPRLSERSDASEPKGFSTPIQRLTPEAARSYVASLFRAEPADLDQLFSPRAWTLAIVGALKPDITVTEGRLSWVLGNGLPIRPDFHVSVNGTRVAPKFEKGQWADLSFADDILKDSLDAQWTRGERRMKVSGRPEPGVDPILAPQIPGDDAETTATRRARSHYVSLPELGRVSVRMRLFNASLHKGRAAAEHGRSEGFFVFVRDRLINADNPKFLLGDPSYGAFNRMQITIWCDGLDEELLADRERIQTTSARTDEFEVLQHSLYLIARSLITANDNKDDEDDETETSSDIPTESDEFYRFPLSALWSREDSPASPPVDLEKVTIDSAHQGEHASAANIKAADRKISVNLDHPLISSVVSKFENFPIKAQQAARHIVELIMVSDLLLKGHMIDIGIEEEVADGIYRWRDAQLRDLAVRYRATPNQVVKEVIDASYPGGKRFELALADLFTLMGFIPSRHGLSGQEDVTVVAPVGSEHFTFTVEAKGSRGKVGNNTAAIDGAAAHARAVGASFSIVVAREFVGFDKTSGDGAAILNQCRTVTPPVAIATTETIIELYSAVQQNHYSLSSLIPILKEIEPPAEKLKTVLAIKDPLDQFDFRRLLDTLWELQQGSAQGDYVGLLQLKQSYLPWKEMKPAIFETIVRGMVALSKGLLVYKPGNYHGVNLRQHPDIVADAIISALRI